MAKTADKAHHAARGYADLHEHVAALEREGLLVRVSREINKDTELHPLVRWQYRGGLKEEPWRGFLFERVTDARGRRYDIPVGVGIMAGSKYVYAVGLGCRPEEMWNKWEAAFRSPIEPIMVESGPVQEIVQTSDLLLRAGGLDQFPVPISTPGFDGAPFITAGHWVTKDPQTGIRKVGNYRGHLKAPDRLGIFPGPGQHVLAHWHKCKERKIPLEAAIVVGPPPVVSYAAVQKNSPTASTSSPSPAASRGSRFDWSNVIPSTSRCPRIPRSSSKEPSRRSISSRRARSANRTATCTRGC